MYRPLLVAIAVAAGAAIAFAADPATKAAAPVTVVINGYEYNPSILTRIHRMKWRSVSSASQFRLLHQTLTLDQLAEFRRTRRVKEGTGSFASVSAAFGPVGPIHPGNPGSDRLIPVWLP